ncbi:MAG: RusA family crossover junction endodeoxyribonuclease [Pseudomonadota bacterium]|nr:RusA family crossover junction endodeoxyribonuclease [Pseudomonadota bacterium]
MATTDDALLADIVIPLEPVPASRPRVTRWGVSYSKAYQAWKDAAVASLKDKRCPIDKDVPLTVIVESVSTKPRTGKLQAPRYDVDNAAKGPMDAITASGNFWADDSQVVVLISAKRYAEPGEEAHTRVTIGRAE